MSVAWSGKDVGAMVDGTLESFAGWTPSGEDSEMNVQGAQIATLYDSCFSNQRLFL